MKADNQRVIIFGATSAIAIECARLWAAGGASLYLVARDLTKLEVLKGDLLARGAAKVEHYTTDLTDFSRHANIIDEGERLIGELDCALLAHGTLGDQKACEASYEDAEKELRTNLLSPISILTLVANRFEARGRGTIVALSSVAGDRGRQSNYIYGAAKGGLTTFLQGLRNRLFQKGVHVITVKPGFVDTPMTEAFPKGPLFVAPGVVARGIHRAIQRRANVVYLPWFWCGIMLIIRHIPEEIFKRMKL